ncbi:MAG: protein-methionine-sulfoxide reductase catalytic subunit MsrP [Methylomonas sp.]|nr:protein-methionine-sulfoxide reductase catalytic subunit MsrP [Methylomonas sp.]PPD22047.1 MAG: protein-methionine-sulfoxide reductase catalytic subunit MsrP [Methylomonas sp.]PPD25239.1 MAG: protein-methionine-sulfoxide reductase catalytic subunit MsrP [Methylomonas sp.]PPD35190.1 MAG: protein-methionine-sulfoxide reductase catalytic subunit MsrP [Methylomonas sp.]PPD42465.1 MAG: protein-methionine-sulfoxide reductase catalytic subunit MsrP [Methylomonas sp.]
MIIKIDKTIPSSEITDPELFRNRRALLKAGMVSALLSPTALLADTSTSPNSSDWSHLDVADNSLNRGNATPVQVVKNYTNYYEFAFDKQGATHAAQALNTDHWSVEIVGEVEKPCSITLEDLLAKQTLKDYVYRFRCVEAWSMVVPWVGFPMKALMDRVKPLSTARYVVFTSANQPEAMPNVRKNLMLAWPYTEGLRIDEAAHPLTLLAVGMYGEVLPKQNGAPLRLVVPWKYGFKSIKAIVKIEFARNAPLTTWSRFAPDEYGFYANVNPNVPHPRWSQYSERPLSGGFFSARRKTELFNGYADQVASLYDGMDLRRLF